MIKVMLTEEQQRLIDEAQALVKLVDRSGREVATPVNGFVLAGWTDAEGVSIDCDAN